MNDCQFIANLLLQHSEKLAEVVQLVIEGAPNEEIGAGFENLVLEVTGAL